MSLVDIIVKATVGAVSGVALITALPLFGAVGTITTAGAIVGAAGGAIAGSVDAIKEDEHKNNDLD